MMTRREALLAGAARLLSAAEEEHSRLSFAGYIWQNYAAREKRPVAELLVSRIYAAKVFGL